MRKVIVSGPVIINKGKLLVVREEGDSFYTLPGGTSNNGESLEKTCVREVREEINGQISITRKLSNFVLRKEDDATKEQVKLELNHYLAFLWNPKEIKPIYPVLEMKWLNIEDIKSGRYYVAPNIEYLVKMGEIR